MANYVTYGGRIRSVPSFQTNIAKRGVSSKGQKAVMKYILLLKSRQVNYDVLQCKYNTRQKHSGAKSRITLSFMSRCPYRVSLVGCSDVILFVVTVFPVSSFHEQHQHQHQDHASTSITTTTTTKTTTKSTSTSQYQYQYQRLCNGSQCQRWYRKDGPKPHGQARSGTFVSTRRKRKSF